MNYKKPLFVVIATAVVFIVAILLLSFAKYESRVVIDRSEFVVEVADSRYLQEKGLSGHSPLKPNEGMFFVFDTPSKYGFWMKDMTFPIDIIWLDSNMRIIHIENNLSPETYPKIYSSDTPALYALELAGGRTNTLNIKIGDKVYFARKWW